MSEISEVRKALQEIRDIAVATRTDVTWIKDEIETSEARLHKLEARMNRQGGQSSVFGAIAGAIFGGAVTFFAKMNS